MSIKLLMPALSPTMTKGKIVKWCISEGGKVNIGDVIAEIETDKAVMEFESVDEGILAKVFLPEGAEVGVGTLLALIDDGSGPIVINSSTEEVIVREIAIDPVTTKKPEIILRGADAVVALNTTSTPAARARAKELMVDITHVPGTGPRGRVQEADVVRYAKALLPHTEVVQVTRAELPGMKKIIADRMTKAKATIPHFYMEIGVYVDKANELRKSLPMKSTLTHWFIAAVGYALRKVPEVNSCWDGGSILQHTTSDIAVAVSLDNGGLITPIVKDVSSMRFAELVKETNLMIDKARSGRLAPNEYQGGTFTISNLGMYSIDSFYPIINEPHAAILGIGSAKEELYLDDQQLKTRTLVRMTLSGDHRVINGTDAAKFMQELKRLLENPAEILI